MLENLMWMAAGAFLLNYENNSEFFSFYINVPIIPKYGLTYHKKRPDNPWALGVTP